MKVSAQYASAHFDELSTAVDGGEVVEIERPQKAALRLVLVESAVDSPPLGPRVLGAGRGKLRVPSEEEWAALDRELWSDFLDESRPVDCVQGKITAKA